MVSIKAVVFDLDGTLIDSASDMHAAAVHMLSALGKQTVDRGQIVSFIGNGMPNLVRLCLEAGGLPESAFDEGYKLFEDYYLAYPTAQTTVYPGVREFLSDLRDLGIPIGLCTNKPSAMTARVLADLSLDRVFDAVVSGDTLPNRKPDPAPLLHALSMMNIEAAKGLYVGDSVVDAKTAAAAKVDFAFFTGGYPKEGEDQFPSVLSFDDLAILRGHITGH